MFSVPFGLLVAIAFGKTFNLLYEDGELISKDTASTY